MGRRFSIFFLACFAVCIHAALASHIVGGEVTYRCLDNNTYSVSVIIYEDCLAGDPGAIAQDNPAFLSVFDGNNALVDVDSVGYTETSIVPANFSNSCISHVPAICLRKKVFTKVYSLPPNATGYTIVYQRCCRNASIINIQNPANIGATYFCTIPPGTVTPCNNSATFNNYPPQIICINNPLFYDHSATDIDGDSLSYEFCNTYTGGNDNNVKPLPSPPPFTNVIYTPPFSYSNPMMGYPRIQIDPVTGLITGTPNLLGRYVVTVCCHEWRKGAIINTLKREFQFVVTSCSKAVIADIPQFSNEPNTYIVNCTDYTVHFKNTSKGGFSYKWDFGVANNAATSTEFEPTFTFPDTGVYLVKLVVNPGSTCPDSIVRYVKIYPEFKAAYDYSGLLCPNSTLTFTDHSVSTVKPINLWSWSFGDGETATGPVATHTYRQGGTYNVVLISANVKGCTDTAHKNVVVERFKPFAGNDTIIVKGEHINFSASGGDQFTWTPYDNLNNSLISNPEGYYPDTGTYRYNVHISSPFGCVGDDSITVLVVNQAAAFVPNAFSPNGDGKNDKFRPVLIGYKSINYFKVFDRWGQIMFYTTSPYEGWDGNVKASPQDAATYFWEIGVTDRFGKEEKLKGDVTLIR